MSTGTVQAGVISNVKVYTRNWLRDEREPHLYTSDVESLRSFVDNFGHPEHARLLQRLLDAVERTPGDQP